MIADLEADKKTLSSDNEKLASEIAMLKTENAKLKIHKKTRPKKAGLLLTLIPLTPSPSSASS